MAVCTGAGCSWIGLRCIRQVVSHRILLQSTTRNRIIIERTLISTSFGYQAKIPAKSIKIRCKTDSTSFIGAILAQDRPEHRFYMIWGRFGVPIWRSKMFPKSIQKSRYFQASLETLFSTIGEPKKSQLGFQNKLKIKFFLELDRDKTLILASTEA